MSALNGIKILLFVISGLVIVFSLCVLYVIMFGRAPDISRLESLQEITLTITAAAIAFVSIISTLIGINREQKLKELEEKLLEAEEALETLHLNEEISAIYFLDNNAFFRFKKQQLEDLHKREQRNGYIIRLLMQSCWDYSELLPDSTECIDLLNQVIQFGKKMEQLWLDATYESSDEEKYTIYYHEARAYVVLGQYLCSKNPEESQKNLKSAIQYFEKARPLIKSVEMQGAYYYYKGLTYFWLYKCGTFLGEDKAACESRLRESINEYINSIELKYFSVYEYNVYNDLGVSYMQKAYLNDNAYSKNKEMELAKQNLNMALKKNPHRHLTYVNLADIEMYEIRALLKVEQDPIRVGKTIDETVLTLTEVELIKILHCVQEALVYLERAKELCPTFPNVHYKKIQLLCYFLALGYAVSKQKLCSLETIMLASLDAVMRRLNVADKVASLLDCSGKIRTIIEDEILQINASSSEKTLGILFVLRNYYDIQDFFCGNAKQEVDKQNNMIRELSKANAEKWDQLF